MFVFFRFRFRLAEGLDLQKMLQGAGRLQHQQIVGLRDPIDTTGGGGGGSSVCNFENKTVCAAIYAGLYAPWDFNRRMPPPVSVALGQPRQPARRGAPAPYKPCGRLGS